MNWYTYAVESSKNDNGTLEEVFHVIDDITYSFLSIFPPITEWQKQERVKQACLYLLTFQNKLGTTGALYCWAGIESDGDYKDGAENGLDCSGSVVTVAVYSCLESPEWFSDCRMVADMRQKMVVTDSPKVGSCAFYGDTHVAMVCYVDPFGQAYVMSMSGGGKTTKNNDPNARAKLVKAEYWSAFTEFRNFPGMA